MKPVLFLGRGRFRNFQPSALKPARERERKMEFSRALVRFH